MSSCSNTEPARSSTQPRLVVMTGVWFVVVTVALSVVSYYALLDGILCTSK